MYVPEGGDKGWEEYNIYLKPDKIIEFQYADE